MLKDLPVSHDDLGASEALPVAREAMEARVVGAEPLLVLAMHSGMYLLALEANRYPARDAISEQILTMPSFT